MSETLKQRLGRDELVRVLGMGRFAHHNLVQIIGIQGGFHGLWFDMEHGALTTEQLEVATLAARSQGMDSFCRIAPTDYATVTRCLEAGAGGIMAAQVSSAEQAETIVQWSKFFPRGARGLNVGGWDAQYGAMSVEDFCRTANRESLVAIQIETASAVHQCEEIAAIDGVDLLFLGPADLSQNLGVPGQFWHEKCLKAMDRVAGACQTHGKPWGAVSVSPDHAELLLGKGCRMLSPTSDVKLINAGIRAVQNDYAKLFQQ